MLAMAPWPSAGCSKSKRPHSLYQLPPWLPVGWRGSPCRGWCGDVIFTVGDVCVLETLRGAGESGSDFPPFKVALTQRLYLGHAGQGCWDLVHQGLPELLGMEPSGCQGMHKAVPLLLSVCKGVIGVQQLMDMSLLSPALLGLGGLRWQLDGLENRLR